MKKIQYKINKERGNNMKSINKIEKSMRIFVIVLLSIVLGISFGLLLYLYF